MFQDPANLWLAAGALIIAIEAFTAPGIGVFLFGLGALCAAFVVKAGIVGSDATAAQFAWCFAATALWAILLWKPLRRFRLSRASGARIVENNNLIGGIAIVGPGGLIPGETGQVLWSGTPMKAELEAAGALSEGAKVVIRSVSGNTLHVVPK